MSPRSKYWGDVSPCPIGIDAPGLQWRQSRVAVEGAIAQYKKNTRARRSFRPPLPNVLAVFWAILYLECVCGWGSALDPAGELTALPQIP